MELGRQAAGDFAELACGTGQLTVPIAAAGLPITGLDLSAPMLNIARERAAAAGVSVEHSLGDMRNFDLGRKFKLIFIARNSLLHLHSIEDFMGTFAAIRRHLTPGGVFAFDIFNTNMQRLARPAGQRFPTMHKETGSFGLISVEGTNDYDVATQVNHARWYISTLPESRMRGRWIWRYATSFRRSCRCCSRRAEGLISKEPRPGELDQRPFDSRSRSQVCICQAAVY